MFLKGEDFDFAEGGCNRCGLLLAEDEEYVCVFCSMEMMGVSVNYALWEEEYRSTGFITVMQPQVSNWGGSSRGAGEGHRKRSPDRKAVLNRLQFSGRWMLGSISKERYRNILMGGR